MDIISRLKMFLSMKEVSSSQFADTCDIPRPTVSQLLNGRNKKVSDEVVSKIHSSYPDLSIMWLLFGEGSMLISNGVPNANNGVSLNVQPLENSKKEGEKNIMSEYSNMNNSDEDKKIVFSEDEFSGDFMEAGDMPVRTYMSKAMEDFAKSVGKRNINEEQVAPTKGVRRKIVNVMVFYSDNSFESFVPDNL